MKEVGEQKEWLEDGWDKVEKKCEEVGLSQALEELCQLWLVQLETSNKGYACIPKCPQQTCFNSRINWLQLDERVPQIELPIYL